MRRLGMTVAGALVLAITGLSALGQATQPATKTVQRWVATDDAPPMVRAWVAGFEPARLAEIRQVKDHIDQLKAKQRDVARRKVPRVPVRNVLGGTSYVPDGAAERRKREELNDIRQEIRDTYARVREMEAQTLYRTQPPTLSVRLDAWGLPAGSVEVIQVVDDSNFIGRLGSDDAWFRGFDTKRHADGQHLAIGKPLIIADRKTYETALGGKRTLFVVEPFDLERYLEIRDVEAQ